MTRRHSKKKTAISSDIHHTTTITWAQQLEPFAWIPCLALMALAPWPAIKVLAGMALLISLRGFNALNRSQAIALLWALFALAYLFSPYATIAAITKNSTLGQTIGQTPAKTLVICVLFAIGTLWAFLAAGQVPKPPKSNRNYRHSELIALVILALLILAFNYVPLHNNIPFQGDESHHIARVIRLRNLLRPLFQGDNLIITAVVFALTVGFLFRPRRIPIHIKLFAICAIGLTACIWRGFPGTPSYLEYLVMRYPLISCWLHQLGPVWNASRFDEGMYRLIPMISAFAIGWFILWALRKENIRLLPAFIIALAFALTPNIYYHSTILYLELPSVALLTVALYFIEPILKDDFKSIRRCPGWYALMAAGFIKETLIIFILGIIGLRLLLRTWTLLKTKRLDTRTILNDAATIFCIATPLAVYLLLRMYFGDVRPYQIRFANLTQAQYYAVVAKAYWMQFAGVLVLAIGGLILALVQRRFAVVITLVSMCASHSFFHFIDINRKYLALARFNLFLFAPLAVLAIWFLGWLATKNRLVLLTVAIMCLITNIAMSPVAITGEKKPMWASPLSHTTTEYYYQYEDTIKWLQTHRTNWPVIVGGIHYTTPVDWYCAKLGYSTKIAPIQFESHTPRMEVLKGTIAQARKFGYPLVLYHKKQGGPALTNEEKSILGYKAVKTFPNRYLTLVLYQIESPPKIHNPITEN